MERSTAPHRPLSALLEVLRGASPGARKGSPRCETRVARVLGACDTASTAPHRPLGALLEVHRGASPGVHNSTTSVPSAVKDVLRVCWELATQLRLCMFARVCCAVWSETARQTELLGKSVSASTTTKTTPPGTDKGAQHSTQYGGTRVLPPHSSLYDSQTPREAALSEDCKGYLAHAKVTLDKFSALGCS